MALKKTQNQHGELLELTSLIDIVFLLLIFFVVSFAFFLTEEVSESKIYAQMELPKSTTELPVIKEQWLENLMIQIIPDTSNEKNSRLAYILWPSYKETIRISQNEAYNKAKRDSTFAAFPQNFLSLSPDEFARIPACTLITNSIERYIEQEKTYSRNARPIIEVSAEQNTEFRILSFIMEECSSHKDAIPQIIVRTIR